MGGVTCLRKDYLASNLRYQSAVLRSVLEDIERDVDADQSFIDESLKRVEMNLRTLRRILQHT